MPRSCGLCGALYEPLRSNSRACSVAHHRALAMRDFYARTKRDRPERGCASCGSVLPSDGRSDRKTCSARCRRALNPSYQKKGWRTARCVMCGLPFRHIRSDARYCSIGCKAVVYVETRRSRKLNNPGSLGVSTREWAAIVRRSGGRCAYCQRPPRRSLQMDHVVPLSRGGRHAIGNVVPACEACNSSKRDRLLADWRLRPNVQNSHVKHCPC
jgi:5-methylcytosine-specific restriction endonuclease McrA